MLLMWKDVFATCQLVDEKQKNKQTRYFNPVYVPINLSQSLWRKAVGKNA